MGVLGALLVPVRCAACAAPAPRGLCGDCATAADRLQLPAGEITVLAPRIAAVGRYAYVGVVADAVRGMKLGGRWAAARPLGAALLRHLDVPGWPTTWVPATRRKVRQRGIDLPRVLAGRAAVPLLRRVSDAPDQTSLSAAQRRASPRGAFSVIAPVPCRVVLVDDVRTTGATALAAAGALVDHGCRRVLVVTLAVGGDAARDSVG